MVEAALRGRGSSRVYSAYGCEFSCGLQKLENYSVYSFNSCYFINPRFKVNDNLLGLATISEMRCVRLFVFP